MQISMDTLISKNKYNTINIIDIRDSYSYNKGHIINAKNIPANELLNNTKNYLNKNEVYYIYCQSGNTSNRVVRYLNANGYHTYDIIGGYNNYLLWK